MARLISSLTVIAAVAVLARFFGANRQLTVLCSFFVWNCHEPSKAGGVQSPPTSPAMYLPLAVAAVQHKDAFGQEAEAGCKEQQQDLHFCCSF